MDELYECRSCEYKQRYETLKAEAEETEAYYRRQIEALENSQREQLNEIRRLRSVLREIGEQAKNE